MTEYIIISPAYNEAKNIERFIKAIERVVPKENFFIIDDGSTDETPDILKKKGVNFYSLPHRGKGFAIRWGIEYALNIKAKFVIFLDSDLQHPPELIPLFIDKLRKGADIVIGSRWRYLQMMPKDRYLSNRLTTFFVSLLVGRRLYDTQSGFRGYRTFILRGISLGTERYETETELLIKLFLSRKVRKIDYVDIPAIYNGAESNIRRMQDTLRFLKMYFGLLWKIS